MHVLSSSVTYMERTLRRTHRCTDGGLQMGVIESQTDALTGYTWTYKAGYPFAHLHRLG